MGNFDNAVDAAQGNSSGAARCILSAGVELIVSNDGNSFAIWDYRPRAKRVEKVVTAAWAHKFLSRALGVAVVGITE